jgi:hypothetical protein
VDQITSDTKPIDKAVKAINGVLSPFLRLSPLSYLENHQSQPADNFPEAIHHEDIATEAINIYTSDWTSAVVRSRCTSSRNTVTRRQHAESSDSRDGGEQDA